MPAAASLARQVIAGRVDEVRADADLLTDAVRILRRVPVNNGHLVALASEGVDQALKALLDSIVRLTAGFD
jgi:hypothetical protein